MKLLRLSIAILILRGASVVAEAIVGPEHPKGLPPRPALRPPERMLLASIVGLAICGMWLWISARAA
jgi:hypothetical protein